MAGAYYIWIFGACFLCTAGVVGLFAGLLWLGHWLERRQTGARHGFLELPREFAEDKSAGGEKSADEGKP